MTFWLDTSGDVIELDPNTSALLSEQPALFPAFGVEHGPYQTPAQAEMAKLTGGPYRGPTLWDHPVTAFVIAVAVLAVFVKVSNKVRS